METPQGPVSELDNILTLFGGLSEDEKAIIHSFFQQSEAERTQQGWLDTLGVLEKYVEIDPDSIHLKGAHSQLSSRFHAWMRAQIEATRKQTQARTQQAMTRGPETPEIQYIPPEGYGMQIGERKEFFSCQNVSVDGFSIVLTGGNGEGWTLVIQNDIVYELPARGEDWIQSQNFSVNPETHQILRIQRDD